MQMYWYIENNDTPSFGNKGFNESPIDLYPAFSYCFEDKFGGIYDEQYFTEIDGLSRQQYQKSLMGENLVLPNNSNPNVVNFLDIDVDNVTLIPKNLFNYMEMHTVNNSVEKIQIYKDAMEDKLSLFYKSYQDPIKICFTRKTQFEKGVIRQIDELRTVRSEILWKMLTRRTKIQIYIHPDGQLTRAFRKPVHWYHLQTGFWPKAVNSFLKLQIVKVSMVRKRPDSKIPCNPELIDDDNAFRDQTMSIVGCVPPYWKKFQTDILSFRDCRAPDEVKEIFDRITDYQTIIEHYDPPCNEMNLVTTVTYKRTVANGMELWYLPDRYEETINRRFFGFEMFWSSIGGFIGMFLGCSLMQLPDMISKLKT